MKTTQIRRTLFAVLLGALLPGGAGCGQGDEPGKAGPTSHAPPAPGKTGSGHADMVTLLQKIAERTDDEHIWIGDREARELRARLADLRVGAPTEERWMIQGRLGLCEGWLGNFEAATKQLSAAGEHLPRIEGRVPGELLYQFLLGAGMVWLRLGEVQNCCARRSSESCILPIRGRGIHVDQEGSRRALRHFAELAERFPDRAAPRWLLNVAAMTIGGYPGDVPRPLADSPPSLRIRGGVPALRERRLPGRSGRIQPGRERHRGGFR